jgi:hypothetical protein
MSSLTDNTEMGTVQATSAQVVAKAKPPGIEAYGVKGLKNRPWRRAFANAEKLLAWCDRNDAIVLGTREA